MDQALAEAIGLVVAVSLALTQALGGLVTYIVEAIKQTKRVPEGYSGIVALVVSMVLGMALAMLGALMAPGSYGFGALVLLGAFAGALMAAGAIKTYKAMGEVNTKAAPERTDMATMSDLDNAMRIASQRTPEELEAVEVLREIKNRRAAELARPISPQDLRR